MKNLFLILSLGLVAGCKKVAIELPGKKSDQVVTSPVGVYVNYNIPKGSHHSDRNILKSFNGSRISFNVMFDNTSIYTTVDPANQNDINKLYGFSENANNHENSARIGWNWNNNALRLYAYAYAGAVLSSKEISVVKPGIPIHAEISIAGAEYIFSVDGKKVSLPRALNTASVNGYIQYPYFGGDEVAPHDIHISIQHL